MNDIAPLLMHLLGYMALGYAVMIVIGCVTDSGRASRETGGAKPEPGSFEDLEKVFKFEARRIAYVDAGTGDAVYLAHGNACTSNDWREQFGPLSEHFRVIAADEPFLGKSDPGPLPRDHRWVATAIWALMDHAGVERLVIVGHSGGASLCREMYLQQPQRVRGFVSVDSGTGGKLLPRDRDGRPLVMPPQLRHRTEENQKVLAAMGRQTDYPSDLNVAILREHEASKPRYLQLTGGQNAPLCTESDDPKWCKVPLLVFTSGRGRMGEQDLTPDPQTWLETRAAGHDAQVVVIRDAGHWVMLEQPQLFNRELIRFVQSLA